MTTGKSSSSSPQHIRQLDERWWGLVASILVHIALVAFLLSERPAPAPEESLVAIDVSFEQPPRTSNPPPQIVSPSEKESPTAPEKPRFESERNSIVEREQIRRGTEGGAPAPPAPDVQPRPERREQPKQNKPAPSARQPAAMKEPKQEQKDEVKSPEKKPLGDLLLDTSTLNEKFGTQKPTPQRPVAQAQASDLSSYQAFSRPRGSGASFLGTGGVSDHLPQLPDGDITLLNEKASTYAGFVRRVAIQVFTHLRSQGWEQLSRQEIRQMGGFTTVEAIMSPTGQLVSARIVEGSGSTSFDSVLNQAVNKGTRDHNPPKGAEASDGRIHFIFKARSWSEVGSDPRSGAPFERRWLLLSTGLE